MVNIAVGIEYLTVGAPLIGLNTNSFCRLLHKHTLPSVCECRPTLLPLHCPKTRLVTFQHTDCKTTQQPRGPHSSLTVTHNFCCSLTRVCSTLIWKSSHIHFRSVPTGLQCTYHISFHILWLFQGCIPSIYNLIYYHFIPRSKLI